MRRGFMGMMLKPRCCRCGGWGNGLLYQIKHGWDGQRSRWCWLFFFFDWKDIVHHEFVPRCQKVNEQLYQEALEGLMDAVRWKRSEMWENQTWMLHHDNAPAQASLLIRSYLAKHQTSVAPHPPYFPDLVQTNFFLFPKIKTTLKGRLFQTIEEIQEKFDKRTARHYREYVPGSIPTMEEMLRTVCRQKRGLLWRGQCLKCCRISGKSFIAKFGSFFEHVLYFKDEAFLGYLNTPCTLRTKLFWATWTRLVL